ncbi:MAG: exodeoxyribonuclease III [Treponema sp.]|jgi:exodeoxyribonuclease-3|nr:exodeoxyribonuclease III [Treponema sp.]
MTTIISWNVNGIRAVEKKGFVSQLLSLNADIVCIQETKAKPEQLSAELLQPGSDSVSGGPVYHSYFSSAVRPGYSGTALYALHEPDEVLAMGIKEFDDEGRVTAACFPDLVVISAYFPNSQQEGARLDYKLRFCDAILAFCDRFVTEGRNVVLCGDYNIAHKAIDLANPKSNETNPGYLPEERAWMDKFTSSGYIDTFRHFNSEPDNYTWWSYRFHAREKNIGWRIDYQCVNERFLPQVRKSEILSDITGSDHCPVRLQID